MENLDDAGVYKLSDDVALIQTIDFFTPIVDDAYMFGQIAAANSLSDIYAMGGRPLTAMNILCFPMKTLGTSILEDILRGGMDKIHEAEVVLIGGHSVDDDELKYGLSVTGIVSPERLVTNSGARVGDRLILTKPLGTGIINTAIKAEVASDDIIQRVSKSMSTLNFYLESIPLFPEVTGLAQRGLCPGGLFRNKDYYNDKVQFAEGIPEHMQDILFDAQTSGGLLICLESMKAEKLLARLRDTGITEASVVGEVIGEGEGTISVTKTA
jgi:selenide,water dikinase